MNNEETTPKTTRSKKSVIIILLVLLVAALGGSGWLYAKQAELAAKNQTLQKNQKDLASAKKKLEESVKSLETQNKSYEAKVGELEKQVVSLQNPKPAVLTVASSGAINWGAHFFFGEAIFVLVDVSIKNTSSSSGYFSPWDFKLKDSSDKVYPLYSQSAVAQQARFVSGVQGLPNERVELRGQEIAPGETVRGTLIFYDKNFVKSFTLIYGNQTLPIKL